MFLNPWTNNVGLLCECSPQSLVILLFEHLAVQSLVPVGYQLLHLHPLGGDGVSLQSRVGVLVQQSVLRRQLRCLRAQTNDAFVLPVCLPQCRLELLMSVYETLKEDMSCSTANAQP